MNCERTEHQQRQLDGMSKGRPPAPLLVAKTPFTMTSTGAVFTPAGMNSEKFRRELYAWIRGEEAPCTRR